MKITKEDVANATIQPGTRITADMVREATERYQNELKNKTEKALVKTKHTDQSFWYEQDNEDDGLVCQVNRRLNQELKSATTFATNDELKKEVGEEHVIGQDLIRDGDDAVDILSRTHYKYRMFVEFDEKSNAYNFFYDNKRLNSFRVSPDMVAGILTQLLDIAVVNSLDNTVAYEDGESCALGAITQALANLISNLSGYPSHNVKCCLADTKLDKCVTNSWIPVPTSYLPEGVIERIEDEVYGTTRLQELDNYDVGALGPSESDLDEMYANYRQVKTKNNIIESDEDFHGFDDLEAINVWDPHGDDLLRDYDVIDWRNVARSEVEGLPKYAIDLSLPIDVFAHCISDALMYELEPYADDLGSIYADYITPAAIYIMLAMGENFSSYKYTPTFKIGSTYTDYRFNLANRILAALGKHVVGDNTWEDATAIDTRHLIEKSIDTAMYTGTLEISSL